jgi:hypothetical protein
MPTKDLPEGIYARIPLDDVILAEACDLVDDKGVWFHTTRIPVLFHFSQVRVDDYWNLTVGDHREMVLFLIARGLVDGG